MARQALSFTEKLQKATMVLASYLWKAPHNWDVKNTKIQLFAGNSNNMVPFFVKIHTVLQTLDKNTEQKQFPGFAGDCYLCCSSANATKIGYVVYMLFICCFYVVSFFQNLVVKFSCSKK